MQISAPEFVERVAATSGPAAAVVTEHLDDNDGELLLHLLVADLRRLAISAHRNSEPDVLAPLLAAMTVGLVEGDEAVENAVAVSFVEDTGSWDKKTADFISSWPAELRAEDERQQAAIRTHTLRARFSRLRDSRK